MPELFKWTRRVEKYFLSFSLQVPHLSKVQKQDITRHMTTKIKLLLYDNHSNRTSNHVSNFSSQELEHQRKQWDPLVLFDSYNVKDVWLFENNYKLYKVQYSKVFWKINKMCKYFPKNEINNPCQIKLK